MASIIDTVLSHDLPLGNCLFEHIAVGLKNYLWKGVYTTTPIEDGVGTCGGIAIFQHFKQIMSTLSYTSVYLSSSI